MIVTNFVGTLVQSNGRAGVVRAVYLYENKIPYFLVETKNMVIFAAPACDCTTVYE